MQASKKSGVGMPASSGRRCAAEDCTVALHGNTKRDYCTEHVSLARCAVPGCGMGVHVSKRREYTVVRTHCSKHVNLLKYWGSLDSKSQRLAWPAYDDPQGWLTWLRKHSDEDEHGCWLGGPTNRHGYVQVGLPKGMPSNGHRLAVWADLYWKTGKAPQMSGLQVDHQCHILSTAPKPQRRCVNPAHLRLREPADNSAEAVYRRVRDAQVRELVHTLRSVAADHPVLERYTQWLS